MSETILEQIERPDGTMMQIVRLSDGSKIAREAPDSNSEAMARIEAAARRVGWSQDEFGEWVHPERPHSSFFDAISLCEALNIPIEESNDL